MDTTERLLMVFVGLVVVFVFVVSPILTIIEYKTMARIYNEQNGTHYTASDFFFAKSQINSNTQTVKLK